MGSLPIGPPHVGPLYLEPLYIGALYIEAPYIEALYIYIGTLYIGPIHNVFPEGLPAPLDPPGGICLSFSSFSFVFVFF